MVEVEDDVVATEATPATMIVAATVAPEIIIYNTISIFLRYSTMLSINKCSINTDLPLSSS